MDVVHPSYVSANDFTGECAWIRQVVQEDSDDNCAANDRVQASPATRTSDFRKVSLWTVVADPCPSGQRYPGGEAVTIALRPTTVKAPKAGPQSTTTWAVLSSLLGVPLRDTGRRSRRRRTRPNSGLRLPPLNLGKRRPYKGESLDRHQRDDSARRISSRALNWPPCTQR
ncbi:hypothetical protein HPB52_024716 [Rhipicephalus sanguineus]|uniref:Uncharacterized protein n=1 Tax=Rhipicephalus sanguineus TaxID=34632 RepID=A0A9D4TE00_RHISA|nr:hypothetical protein HPB52_024716 [Rhipicephalus sanguineus]